ncbi:hypothetical protein G7085_17005 [Tessaracoccus sp. HDW20]|uniref:hypothetical protein n=1 Tax=Tessaracoccus coleopterorum TaxID=2714950 RepID=UPI0018D2EA3A|nr:hypothetical protein [Tessaracoccus coleopterorum]NHB85715.1 hypothetical protein [Tessaracoccus coleopterorum]
MEELCAALVRSGVIDEVERMIDASVRAAERTLTDAPIDPVAAEGLRGLARRLAWRTA